jgi:hypothetical protein
MSEWTLALALRRFKEEAVLAHVVRSPLTLLHASNVMLGTDGVALGSNAFTGEGTGV